MIIDVSSNVAVGRLAWDRREVLAAIDLNPVIVGVRRTVAVDVLVAMGEGT